MSSHRINTLDELTTLYRAPSARVQAKKTNHVGPSTQSLLALSPFALLATADEQGRCDVSPRGGAPGQLKVLDEHTVALPDLGGNNLIDSLRNIVLNGQAGLLVVTPGTDETVRIDGRAHLSTDPDVLSLWDAEVRRPKLAVVVEVDNVFIHCAKAFRRSELWNPATWPSEVTDACELLLEHVGAAGQIPVSEVRAGLEADYEQSLAAERPV